MSATYRALHSFRLAGEVRVESAEGQNLLYRAAFDLAAIRPDRSREAIETESGAMLRVSDGHEYWTYLPGVKQYARVPGPGPDVGDAEAGGGAGIRAGLAGGIMSNYRGIGMTLDRVEMKRVEYVPFQGADRECYVLQASYQPAGEGPTKTFWVDRESFQVLKHSIRSRFVEQDQVVEQVETVVYDRVDLDQPLPGALFTFTPPPGTKEVRSFDPERVDLTGQMAFDFALEDLSGRTHSLKADRGKVVMLDFWATWCGPCRLQMPAVDKLFREFRTQGLVVYAINQRESAKVAGAYIRKQGYETTTLLDSRGAVGDLYKVVGIPTLVVIDRKGRIAAHYVGVHAEEQLREALTKVGLSSMSR